MVHAMQVDEAFEGFLVTFQKRNMLDEGFFTIAKRYAAAKQESQAVQFLLKALETNSKNVAALQLLKELDPKAKPPKPNTEDKKTKKLSKYRRLNKSTGDVNDYTNLLKKIENEPNNANVCELYHILIFILLFIVSYYY